LNDQQHATRVHLSTLIRAYRRNAGLTQRQLADRSGLSVATVRDVEQARSRPRPASLRALAGALGLDAAQAAALTAVHQVGPSADAPADHRTGLWLTALGPLEARRNGQRLHLGPQQVTVLGLLAVQPGRLVRRAAIAEALWCQHPPATAPDLVQAQISRLRRIIDPGGRLHLIEQGTGGYRLRALAASLDVAAFGELTGRAQAAAEAGRERDACELFARALELWHGDPAAGIEVLRHHPAIACLERQRQEAVTQYAAAAAGLGWHMQVIPLLENLVWEQPLDEPLHAALIIALAGTGRQAAALAVYEDLRLRLREEIGAEPSPALAAAHQRALRGDIPPAVAPRAAAAGGPSPLGNPDAWFGVRSSLPPDPAAFTGREPELGYVTAALADLAGTGGRPVVHVISGMAGIGKTALAVHAAHLLKDRFPDRQLFLRLHAHTPGQAPVTPEAALAGLLAAVGIDARYLPDSLDGRVALWRDRMTRERALLVLDDAASSAQVSPLLPGSGDCLVLVTSRRHLGDLAEAAAPVLLGELPSREARAMFTRLAPRAATGPLEAVAELTELAGRLPLALSLLARVYAAHPSWSLADLAAETRSRMLTLTAENDSVAAALEVSYQHLALSRQEFFRRLSLHPGTTVDGYAAAALAGCDRDEAVGQLDALYREGLLAETGHRRYGMHDLVRRYAWDLAAADPAVQREQALGRLFDYYQQTAARAEELLARHARTSPQSAPAEAGIPRLADPAQALAWLRSERASLLACLSHATTAGQYTRVVALTAAMASLLRLDGPWDSAVARHAAAVSAAEQVGDGPGLANALLDLGAARRLIGDHDGATRVLQRALDACRDAGDRPGQAVTLIFLADVHLATGDHHAAVAALKAAVDAYPGIGSRLGQTTALTDLRGVRRMAGDHQGAAEALQHLLAVFRDRGDRLAQATPLTFLGVVRLAAADTRGATGALSEALAIYRASGDPLGTATALTYLGDARLVAGDHRRAVEALGQALEGYRGIGHRLGTAIALIYLGDAWRISGNHRDAAQALEEARSIFQTIGDRGGEAMALNATGTLHRARGDSSQAERCHRLALDLAKAAASHWDEAQALAGLSAGTALASCD
jgi:DNA-binding SARP family transcriptional activator/DNA-binding XRE family transcriptional regulator